MKFAIVLRAVFMALLLWGVFTDVRHRRVSNQLVLVLLVTGVAGAFLGVSQAGALGQAGLAGALGLALWLPFWLAGLLGAGDVKYFAAASSWLSVALTWRAAVIAALVGGIMSLAVMVWRSGFRQTAASVSVQAVHARDIIANADVSGSDAAARTFPYALPMAVGLAAAAFAPARVLALFGI